MTLCELLALAAALKLGAAAAQLGTAFIACPESQADAGFRAALFSQPRITPPSRAPSPAAPRAASPAASPPWAPTSTAEIPAYPIAYDAAKALHTAAKSTGEYGFVAQWAGRRAPLARALPAADLVATLATELTAALAWSTG